MPQAAVQPRVPQSPVRWWLVGAAALCCGVCLILGPWPVSLAGVLVLICTAKGAVRGVAPVVGVLAGVVADALGSGPLARMLERPIGGVIGLGGLAARLVSICIVGGVILLLVTWTVTPLMRRWMRRRPALQRWDGVAGGSLGVFEGLGLTLVVCWIVLGVAPLADVRTKAPGAMPDPRAERFVGAAKVLRESALGGVVLGLVPLPDAGLMGLVADFVEVADNPEAMRSFLASEPVQRIEALPSARQVLGAMEQDPSLRTIVRGERPIDAQGVLAILNSDALLKALDASTLLADASPLAADVRAALDEAKRQARASDPGAG